MRFLIGLIVILIVGAPLVCPQPARAQDTITGYDTVCTPHDAEFNTFAVTDDTRPDGTPYHEGRYPGEYVRIFNCKVAGHYVRMNFMSYLTQLECGAMAKGRISVWIDGHKVVEDADWNDHTACLTESANSHPPAHVLTRLIFNNRMNLTTCHTDYVYDEKSYQASAKSACTLTDLSSLRPDLKSIFYGPVKLTPDRLLLMTGNPAFCAPIRQALNGPHPDSGLLAALPELSLSGNPNEDQGFKGRTQTFLADIDNDGIVDTVTYNGLGTDMGAGLTHDFTWQSSGTGGIQSVRRHWPQEDAQLNVDDPHVFRFVRINGRVYAFAVDDDLSGLGGAELSPADAHLVELHSDGRETEVCAWKPQNHPEEAL